MKYLLLGPVSSDASEIAMWDGHTYLDKEQCLKITNDHATFFTKDTAPCILYFYPGIIIWT